MTPHDSEMNVLLGRYANVSGDGKNTEHLDADELNAFAEGALPPAARSRYVSHLADCDDCRRAVTELAGASGRLEPMAVPASQSAAESWWQKIGAVLAPARLRYAAFVAILVAVVGIGYTVWRQSREAPGVLTASNEQRREEAQAPRRSQAETSNERGGVPHQSPTVAKTNPQPTPAPFVDQKQLEPAAANPPPPPKPADALARNEKAPSAPATAGANVSSANAAPAYAPPPTTESERSDNRAREQQNLNIINGPQRGESVDRNKSTDDRSRGVGDFAKGRDEDRSRTQTDQPVAKEEVKDETTAARKRSAQRPATLGIRSTAGERQEEPKSDKAGPPEEADTRSVGGRKFKRQGNSWVDVKLKSSMSIKTVSRGSEDFEKLDSGLRSIAQQLSGPIVVVWKGKAYRIQ